MDADYLLIRKMRQGNEDALDNFVRKYYPDILRYCSCHCFDREYAKDLTQETFVRFFGSLSFYRHSGKVKNYLYTIAGNLCKDYYKKRTEVLEEPFPEGDENQMERLQDKLLVEWALRKLPGEFREVILLYYFQDLKLKEIADVQQIGLPLVKYRMKRAKEMLEKLLKEEGQA